MQSKHMIWLFLATLLLTACGGKTMVESDLGLKGAPDWVNEGTQYLNDRNGRLFHGVGQAADMGNTSLQISTADNRARAEVARILTSYLDVVSNDFTSASGDGKQSASQENVSRQINNLSRVNLSGVKIIGHWMNEKDGTVYSIAELDLDHVKNTLALVKDMNSNLKRYITDHGENTFDKISGETK